MGRLWTRKCLYLPLSPSFRGEWLMSIFCVVKWLYYLYITLSKLKCSSSLHQLCIMISVAKSTVSELSIITFTKQLWLWVVCLYYLFVLFSYFTVICKSLFLVLILIVFFSFFLVNLFLDILFWFICICFSSFLM